MNAKELFDKNGKSANVFYCAECRCVKRTKEEADVCCDKKCQSCGKHLLRGYTTTCPTCQQIAQRKKEAHRFTMATKVKQWDGWVYLEGTGREGFSESLEDFWEDWENSDRDPTDEKPAYVWACKAERFAHINLPSILNNIAEAGYEDFDTDDLKGLKELEEAIDKFNELNKDVVFYQPDYTIAVMTYQPDYTLAAVFEK